MRRAPTAGLLVGLAFLLAGCRASAPSSGGPGAQAKAGALATGGEGRSGESAMPDDSVLDPGALDHVTALSVAGRTVFVGSESGIVRLEQESGDYLLLPEAEGASSEGVAALALGADGTLWSAHRVEPTRRTRGGRLRGGVRAFRPGAVKPLVFSAAQGLGGDDVAALAVSPERVVAGVDGAVAQLWLGAAVDEDGSGGERPEFVRGFEEGNRKLQVVSHDEEGTSRRTVFEFRPRGERVLSLALAEPHLWIGTTHGLYRLTGSELLRYEIPCRVEARPPRRVPALAARGRGVVAVLALDLDEGEWRPGGLLELEGESAWRCHVPNEDVPDSASLMIAEAEGTLWLASYEGPTRIRGADAVLLDEAAGAPSLPATAIAAVSADEVWVGTWGGGAWHLRGREWTLYSMGPEPVGRAETRRGSLR